MDASNETALYAAALGAALALAAPSPAAQQLAAALNSTAAPATAFLPLDASVPAAEAQQLLDLLGSDPVRMAERCSWAQGAELPEAGALHRCTPRRRREPPTRWRSAHSLAAHAAGRSKSK